MHQGERDLWKQDFAQAQNASPQIEKVELTPKTLAIEAIAPIEPSIPASLLAYTPDQYRLGAHDEIQIIVWDHPEITAPAGPATGSAPTGRPVDALGNLFVPYAGNIHIAGMTTAEARQLITERMARYIDSPQVDLVVTKYASQRFTVIGEVQDPGVKILANQPINILDAIASAKGYTDIADQRRLTVVRDGQQHQLDMTGLMARRGEDLARLYIKAGDVIHVADKSDQKVYVLGEVNRPMPVDITTHGLTLTDALGVVGGVSQIFSDAGSVYVVRATDGTGEKARLYHLDANSPTALVVADNFRLQPRDVVFVGAASVTRWNRVISQLLPSLTTLSLSSDVTKNLGY
ncbi:MAG: polysaccharide biosynthesis/export family protein [Pseudomonadota bacterium]